jgi:Cu/Ag efflux protein CusF
MKSSLLKSSLLKSALVAVVGLALCAPVALHAQAAATTTTTASTTSTTTVAKVKKIRYTGTVKSVDTAANAITVTCKKGDMTFAVTPMTKITSNKAPAALTDITMGEKVTGSFVKNADGTMTAASIYGHPLK